MATRASAVPLEVVIDLPTPPVRGVGIYSLIAPKVDRARLEALAHAFGLDTDTKRVSYAEDAVSLHYDDGQRVVRVFKNSGGVRMADLNRWQRDQGEGSLDIGETRARALATPVLRRLRVAAIKQLRFERLAPLRVATANVQTGEGAERIIDVAVVFQQVVDGLPVDGPGGRAVVYLDARGVTGCDLLLPGLGRRIRKTSLRPPEFAVDAIRRRLRTKTAGRARLTELRLAYFAHDWTHRQRMLQPAYIAFLELLGPDGVRTKRIEIIAAATRPAGALQPAQSHGPTPRQPKRPEPRILVRAEERGHVTTERRPLAPT